MEEKILTLFSVLFIVVVILVAVPKNETHEPAQKPEWCYFYTYNNKENFDLVKHSPHIFVKINGDKRTVFVKCDYQTLI